MRRPLNHPSVRIALLTILALGALNVSPAGSAGAHRGAALPPPPTNAPAVATAPPLPLLPFTPATIADLGPIQTSSPNPTWLGISGDWVGYAAGMSPCGHCNTVTSDIYVQNVITGRRVVLRTATIITEHLEVHQGADPESLLLRAGKLIWEQPTADSTPSFDPDAFRPGTFDCARCYYDLDTGQGGLWNGGALPPDPPSDFTATAEPGPPPTYDPTTFKVVQRSTGRLAINARMPDYQRASMITMGTDKLAFYQTQFTPTNGSLGSPQLIQLVWLVPPDPAFAGVWSKADQAVASRKAKRSWLWGPAPFSVNKEAYAEGVDGTRIVQYYDKSRMEVNDPGGNRADPYFVTNGLLVTEMIAGQIQVANFQTITASVPCTIPVAGDPLKDNPLTPSYAALAQVASLRGDNRAPDRTGQFVVDSMDAFGGVGAIPAGPQPLRYAAFVPDTGHNVPDIFLRYLTSMKTTYGFDWVFVLGYPITEAYWTRMRVSGKDYPVAIQAYQRRVLTYVPAFPVEWQVQQGNVGQHYFEWRYSLNAHRPYPALWRFNVR